MRKYGATALLTAALTVFTANAVIAETSEVHPGDGTRAYGDFAIAHEGLSGGYGPPAWGYHLRELWENSEVIPKEEYWRMQSKDDEWYIYDDTYENILSQFIIWHWNDLAVGSLCVAKFYCISNPPPPAPVYLFRWYGDHWGYIGTNDVAYYFPANVPTATFMAVYLWDYPNQQQGELWCDEAHIYSAAKE